MSSLGSTLGAAAGTALLPGVGTVVGGALGKSLTGLASGENPFKNLASGAIEGATGGMTGGAGIGKNILTGLGMGGMGKAAAGAATKTASKIGGDMLGNIGSIFRAQSLPSFQTPGNINQNNPMYALGGTPIETVQIPPTIAKYYGGYNV